MHPVRNAGGTRSHEQAFDAIAAGMRPRCNASTLHWLEDHMLIERHSGDRPSFSVPPWAHVAWCEWCAGAEQRRERISAAREARKG